jgi:bla regulator protein BlaR1
MNALAAVPLDSTLLHYVVEPAARSLALGGAVWLLLTAFRVRDISFRLAAWTAVLYAALAMPFLGKMLPEIPFFLPALHETPAATTPAPAIDTIASASTAALTTSIQPSSPASDNESTSHAPVLLMPGAAQSGPENEASFQAATPAPRASFQVPWLFLAGIGYCLVAAIFLGRFGLGLFLSRRLRRGAAAIDARELDTPLERETRNAGLRKPPLLAESPALTVPATLGVIRPLVLLPSDWRDWNEAQMSAVLAHELSHIARRDAVTQLLAALHRSLFWFSPLSWWLDRSLDELAEQASDDAALRAGADRTGYAEVLLNFFASLKTARGRVRWQAVSMAKGARSERRLERILDGDRLSRRLGQTALVGVALGALPLVCLAAALQPSLSAGQMPTAPPPPAPPAIAKAPVAPAALAAPPAALAKPGPASPALPVIAPPALASPPQTPKTPATAPLPPTAGAPVLPPAPPAQQQSEVWSFNNTSCGGNQAFAIVSGDRIMTECGSAEEIDHVRKLRERISGPFLWFRRNGRSYVIRDHATVKAALDAFAPQEALGRQQAELGRKQARLGARQAELGLSQSRIRVDIPDLSAQMASLDAAIRSMDFSATQAALNRAQAQLAAMQNQLSKTNPEDLAAQMQKLDAAIRALDSSATQQMLGRVQAELGAMQRRLGSLQSQAGESQAALARRQAELGAQQAALGRQQAALGRQQAELARKAMAQVRGLIEKALASGLAKPQ